MKHFFLLINELTEEKKLGANPYEEAAAEIEAWANAHFYDDFVVSLLIDGRQLNTLLLFNGSDFEWNDDWWEGEKNVTLVAFAPVTELFNRGGK